MADYNFDKSREEGLVGIRLNSNPCLPVTSGSLLPTEIRSYYTLGAGHMLEGLITIRKVTIFFFLFLLKVKDLKRQLKLERKRGEQLQQKLQEALSENRVKPGEN